MIWIYLKLLVATVLIAIPLMVRYLLCSKNNQKTKIDNLPDIMKKNIPRWKNGFLNCWLMVKTIYVECLLVLSIAIYSD